MRAMLRQFRRAPGRIVASIFALTLAVAAMGVLAIPTVSEGTLHETADRDGLADIIVDTSPLDADQLEAVAAIDGVAAAEGQTVAAVTLDDGTADGFRTRIVGLDLPDNTMDRLALTAGRLPTGADEAVVPDGTAAPGDTIVLDGHALDVVGTGDTLWWSEGVAIYTHVDTALAFQPDAGVNHLVLTAVDDDRDSLDAIADAARGVLAADGDTFTTFPALLPDGSTPIDEDMSQISFLIGMLGVVAGMVAMVLLASTTTTLITSRTREVAVMRALGGRRRPLRRRLRRIALAITAIALVIGLPIGVLISNLIARLVLDRFVGITPAFAVDWWVVGGSALAMLAGARLVAARSARRVTSLDLATALRDREGSPYGQRWYQRLAARIPTGGLAGRLAARANLQRPARTLAVTAQIAAAVGAAFLVPTLISSVNEFNSATQEPWAWESVTRARDPGLPFDAAATSEPATDESGVWIEAELADDEVYVYGLDADTSMFVPTVDDGQWFEAGTRQAVVSRGFAEHRDLAVGETVTLGLSSGPVEYELVGTVDDHSVAVYLDKDEVAADLGSPGMANVVWSESAVPASELAVATRTSTAAELAEEDEAARSAVVVIFGAIGAIVAGVAALAVASSMGVSLFERRHELAALRAIGARRRTVRGVVLRELVPVGLIGTAMGVAAGAYGADLIIGSFEAGDGIDIGVAYPWTWVPLIALGTAVLLAAVATAAVRSAARRPIAVTLRSAA